MKNDPEKEADMKAFEDEIKAVSSEFPNYQKKEFTFTNLERQMLANQATIVSLAHREEAILINEYVLKRLDIKPDPTTRVRYSVGLGRFVVFSPKSANI